MPFSSSPITVKDAAAADKSLIAYNDGTSSAFAHPILNTAGVIVDPATSTLQSTANTKLDSVIGNTGAAAVTVTVSPTVASTTHALNDVVGGKLTLSGAARFNGGSGLIQSVTVGVTDNVTVPYNVFFFDTDPTGSTFTDDAALSIVAADLPYCCGVVHCTDVVDAGTRKLVQATGLAVPFKISASNTSLFAVIVARGSAAFTTANGISLRISVLQA